jgi:pectinesterase
MFFFSRVLAVSCTSPPSGAINVCLNPVNSGEYGTVQEVANSLLYDSSSPSIFIYSRTYNEQVYITKPR